MVLFTHYVKKIKCAAHKNGLKNATCKCTLNPLVRRLESSIFLPIFPGALSATTYIGLCSLRTTLSDHHIQCSSNFQLDYCMPCDCVLDVLIGESCMTSSQLSRFFKCNISMAWSKIILYPFHSYDLVSYSRGVATNDQNISYDSILEFFVFKELHTSVICSLSGVLSCLQLVHSSMIESTLLDLGPSSFSKSSQYVGCILRR